MISRPRVLLSSLFISSLHLPFFPFYVILRGSVGSLMIGGVRQWVYRLDSDLMGAYWVYVYKLLL